MGASCSSSDTVRSRIFVDREELLKAYPLEEDLKHWHMWNQLDLLDEAAAERLAKFMRTLMDTVVPSAALSESGASHRASIDVDPTFHEDVALNGDIDLSQVELHDNIHMDWPLNPKQVEDMTQDFEVAADDVHIPLPSEFFSKLVKASTDFYASKPNVINLTVPPDCTLTIVGDLHGQLQDLLHIFKTNGLPSPTNWYLFNGDLVDRGDCCVEICAILFAYQIMYPMAVHINRGNHEDVFMNSFHTFRREVYVKYSSSMFDAFNDFFDALPLAHIINDAVFVVHGGLSEFHLTLDQINSIPRDEYHLHTTHDETLSHKMHWMQDFLWSDPQRKLGIADNRRGAGVMFGPDICAKFLQRTNLKMIVRSHEHVREGFNWPYDYDEVTVDGCVPATPPTAIPTDSNIVPEKMLVTIFSCSNTGAYMVLRADLRFHIETYKVASANILHRGLPTFRSIEYHNRHNIIELIVLHKSKLAEAFAELDHNQTNLISVDQWAEVLHRVLELELDWKPLAPVLTTVAMNGVLNYSTFLEIDLSDYHNKPALQSVCDALYPYRKQLEVIFCFFDQNHTGEVTLEEFKQGIYALNAHLPPAAQWNDPTTLFHDIDMYACNLKKDKLTSR
ncbi:hypothetical protein LEN26_002079 [Aphanomyces euteiches]|nr:hypothetical protein AeMF1_019189 [Aphanomyces euteiches]KAH9159965.1 hypothetical protein LEN26_002079 [Aphanomyces euteiches]KAH9184305.1 hypothetical protein AeNC1_013720 [Aphanomyces euteiches]